MSHSHTIHVGIDIGKDKCYAVVIYESNSQHRVEVIGLLSLKEAVALCRKLQPRTVTIDAPRSTNTGIVHRLANDKDVRVRNAKSTNLRLGEWLLRITGCYATPGHSDAIPEWMQTGMTLFEELSDLPTIETHPTYAFKSALGVEIHGDRWICDPDGVLAGKQPRMSRGHLQRIAILLNLLPDLKDDDKWTTHAHESIDITDATMCAAVGLRHSQGQTIACGDEDEGQICILRDCNISRDTLSAHLDLPERRSKHHRLTANYHEAQGLLLRTSDNERLTMAETKATLEDQEHYDGQSCLPILGHSVGKYARRVLERDGGEVLVAAKSSERGYSVYAKLKGARIVEEDALEERSRASWRQVATGSATWWACGKLVKDDLPSLDRIEGHSRHGWQPFNKVLLGSRGPRLFRYSEGQT